MSIGLNHRWILWAGLATLFVLNLGHAGAHFLLTHHPSGLANALEALFDFDREGNLSTLYNGMLILWAGLLAAMISLWRKSVGATHWIAWSGITLILGFLFVDELCGLHDSLDFFLLERLETSGSLAWPWVIAYGALTLFVAAIYLPFFFRLPRQFRYRFGLAAFFYVAGALGLEMVAADHVFTTGREGAIYPVLVALEESLEMGGLLLAGHAFIRYLDVECPGFRLLLETKGGSELRQSHHANPPELPERDPAIRIPATFDSNGVENKASEPVQL